MKRTTRNNKKTKDEKNLAAVFCVLRQRGTGLLAKLATKKEAARWPPLDWHAERARRRNPPLERKAQAEADLARASHDREVVAPGVASVEPAVHVELVEQVF